MSSVDDVLATVGEAVTILRGAGNVSTFFYIYPPKTISMLHGVDAMLPTTSGILGGDLIQHGSIYYLVVGVYQDKRAGEFFNYKVRLLKCNSVVTLRTQNSTTKQFANATTGVRCLIASGGDSSLEDKSQIISRYNGRDNFYDCYLQASVGLTKNNLLVDGAGKVFRVSEELDSFFASGIIRAKIKQENA